MVDVVVEVGVKALRRIQSVKLLHDRKQNVSSMASWQSDYAVDCKSAYRGLIPLPVSKLESL